MKITAFTKKKFLQGIGVGYIVCLGTHVLAALLPMYIVFPFVDHLFDHENQGVLGYIFEDMIILTMIIIPVALLTWVGHRIVALFRCKCGVAHEEDPCERCPHRKF